MNIFTAFHKVCTRVIRKIQSLLGIITIGPRAIVLNEQNQVLLVKHSYQPHWYLPGGGAKKRESAKTALLRELREEVGLVVTHDEPQLFGIYYHTYLDVDDYPIIYIVKNYSRTKCNSAEISQMAWHSYSSLPEMISPGTKRRLDEYFLNTVLSESW